MNEHDDVTADQTDTEANQLFALLKQVQPPLESQVQFRAAVASELARMQARPAVQGRAWWRRSVTVPIPVALALGLLAIVGIRFSPFQSTNEIAKQIVVPDSPHSPNANGDTNDETPLLASTDSTSHRFASTIYLCGVGPLQSETYYRFEE